MYTQIQTWIFRLISTFLAAIASIGIIFFTGPGSDASAQIFSSLSAKDHLPPPAKICDIDYSRNVEKDERLWEAAEKEKKLTLDTLESLVNIQTGTFDHKGGMEEIANEIQEHLEKINGMKVEQIEPTTQGSGDGIGKIVVGTLEGTKKDGKKLLLIAHMDTVYPYQKKCVKGYSEEEEQKNCFKGYSEGKEYATGPGVGDDKAGIALILHSLKLLRGENPRLEDQDFGKITVLINADEEKGSIGSSAEIEKRAKESNVVIFSYESTQFLEKGKPETDELISESLSGVETQVVTVKGEAAHAGSNPEEGINALVAASDLVKRTLTLDQGQGNLRFNWTIFDTTNKVSNIIPDKVQLTADVRYSDDEEKSKMYRDLDEKMKETEDEFTNGEKKAELSLEKDHNKAGRPPFKATAQDCALIQNAVDIYRSVGGKIQLIGATGGGTDAGFASKSNNPVIEGLGLPGYGYHSQKDEGVYIEAIPRRLYLSAKMILNEAKGL